MDRVRSVNEGAFARRFTAKVSKGAKKGEGRRGKEGTGSMDSGSGFSLLSSLPLLPFAAFAVRMPWGVGDCCCEFDFVLAV